jgi:hypothetical protein
VPEWLNSLWLRLVTLVRRHQLDRDLDDEVTFHLAMREAQLRAAGASDARTAARRRFGSVTRLVRLWEEHPGATTGAAHMSGQRWLSNRTFAAWAPGARTIDVVGGYGSYEYTVGLADDAKRLVGSTISPNLLAALAPTPTIGRLFGPRDAEAGAARVVVISEGFWRSEYAADPAVLGRPLTIEAEPYTIVGVLSSRFVFPDRRMAFWLPYRVPDVAAASDGPTPGFSALARLRPGVTPEQAEAEGTVAARSVPRPMSAELMFGKGRQVVVRARPLLGDVTGPIRPALLVLAAVGLVLLVASLDGPGAGLEEPPLRHWPAGRRRVCRGTARPAARRPGGLRASGPSRGVDRPGEHVEGGLNSTMTGLKSALRQLRRSPGFAILARRPLDHRPGRRAPGLFRRRRSRHRAALRAIRRSRLPIRRGGGWVPCVHAARG